MGNCHFLPPSYPPPILCATSGVRLECEKALLDKEKRFASVVPYREATGGALGSMSVQCLSSTYNPLRRRVERAKEMRNVRRG